MAHTCFSLFCYSKHRQPPRHPRYPERPGYHNHASSGVVANNITTNAVHEATKNNGNEEDSFGQSLNIAPAQYQRLIASW